MSIVAVDDWISDLPDDARAELQNAMVHETVAAGTDIHVAGSNSRGVLRVGKGYVRLTSLREDGRQTLLCIFAPGACFGEAATLARRPLNNSATAITDVQLARLPIPVFHDLYRRHREIPDMLCRKFARTASRQVDDRKRRAEWRIGGRVAATLADLVDRCGVTRSGSLAIDLPVTHTDLAEHLDVTRQSIQLEVSALRRADIARKEAGVWIINDPIRLRHLAASG